MAPHRAFVAHRLSRCQPFSSQQPGPLRFLRARSSTEEATEAPADAPAPQQEGDLDKQIQRFTRSTAATFAPRPSTAQKNPAVRDSTLYWVFECQAWLGMVVGAFLSYNLLFPTDGPSIPRLLGCGGPPRRQTGPPSKQGRLAPNRAPVCLLAPPAPAGHAHASRPPSKPPAWQAAPRLTAPLLTAPPPLFAPSMWSVWMFTIPSLRARECLPREKDALNILFVLVPLMNITLPFVWKSFPFIFTMDVAALASIYYAKGVWKEVYGLPLEPPNSS
jgi:hypothetical protein